MRLDWMFFVNSILLGVGLAMDAFSVSLANGLNEPKMPWGKMCAVAGVFGVFQALMPLLGWLCVHTVVRYFQAFERLVPWIALALLSYIGAKMVLDGIRGTQEDEACSGLGFGVLMAQGVATSIDALSVGFTIADYDLAAAVTAAALIAAVTFLICLAGLLIGRKAGTRLSGKAGIFGGVLLILIGIEIFVSGLL
ncbi:MAG: manganese efflux pump [Firmicutes bacterium]|nr:manganese efflux pump [Bacillota bacterium]